MKKIYILSHTDLDGFVSAGLAQYFESKKSTEEVQFKHKSWTYGRDIPNVDNIRKEYDKFILVDLCLDNETMDKLCKLFSKDFIWIDHHVIPDNNYLDHYFLDVGKYCTYYVSEKEHVDAACSLVYSFYNPREQVPYWLRLVSDFDCWNRYDEKYWNEEVMPYFSYLKSRITSPETALSYINELDYRINEVADECGFFKQSDINYKNSIRLIQSDIKIGTYMFKSVREMYDADCKHGFEAVIEVAKDRFEDLNKNKSKEKLKAYVCNTQNRSSVIFENMKNRDDYDVFIPYHFNGKRFYYSMYTFKKDIKCNRIRVYFMTSNGISYEDFNGHDEAAGCNSEYFIINSITEE